MVPRIADTGHSFKGAGLYYIHDKKAKTKDRVEWTHIHNIPTRDPDKAFRLMAYTAMNAQYLKQQAGVPLTGRKAKNGSVYSYSLAWHPDQQPEKQTMLDAALETLGLLQLEEHEAVMVAHNDTNHPHVHVVCNLIHPETGKKTVPSYDRLILSAWAEEVERNEGLIYCEQRVINNELRRNGRGEGRQFQLIKFREKIVQRTETVRQLYEQSDSAKALKAGLDDAGYTLAKGDRRGFVLVDKDGEVYALARQLENQRAADIRARLKDVGELPLASELAHQRKHFDRDQYETERQQKIVDAAIEVNKKKQQPEKQDPKKSEQAMPPHPDDEHLRKLDELRAWEQKGQRQKGRLKKEQDDFYNREEVQKLINEKEQEIFKNKKKEAQRQKELEALKKRLVNIDQRMKEQDQALDKKLEESKPGQENTPDENQSLQHEREGYFKKKLQSRKRNEGRKGPKRGR